MNILETAATLKLFRDLAVDGGDVSFVFFGDSHVSRSALARGRTSSLALRPLLKQASSLSIAYGLYAAGRYSPTRSAVESRFEAQTFDVSKLSCWRSDVAYLPM